MLSAAWSTASLHGEHVRFLSRLLDRIVRDANDFPRRAVRCERNRFPTAAGSLCMVLAESTDELERGETAPAFELPDPQGEQHALSEFDTDAVLVVFTCNHCPYAKAKFDLLNQIAADYDDCAVVGINPNDADTYPEDSVTKMAAYVNRGEIAYDAYLRDESQTVARAYGAVCTPDPFLLSREPQQEADEHGDETDWLLRYHGRLDDAPNPNDSPSQFPVTDAIDAILENEPVEVDQQPARGCSIKWTDE